MTTRPGTAADREPAGRVLARAHDSGVPLDADPALLRLLVRVDRGEDLPPQLHAAAALILEFAWSVADGLAGHAPPDPRSRG